MKILYVKMFQFRMFFTCEMTCEIFVTVEKNKMQEKLTHEIYNNPYIEQNQQTTAAHIHTLCHV